MQILRLRKPKRMAVISLDGFPYSLMRECLTRGDFPELQHRFPANGLKVMQSVYPTVSSVAWST
ncbi:MAG TPA: hypothetical protein PLV45_17390, partial [bacterium]|nr:hypothetical protein [bacterium]